jgi:ribonucleoside-diphosphate reductase alpha chain
MKNYGEELGWELGVDFPTWANTEIYVKTISKGYLLAGEVPKDAYWRVATASARRLKKPQLASKFFDYIWRGWLNLASPVLSNMGTDRGLPISCFGIDVADSIQDIGTKNLELMLLAKHGGGVGIGINQIRPAGKPITDNGTSDGVVPFAKIYDSTILATNQGAVRRGAASVNLNIEHEDFDEWIEIREPKGDVNRQCLNLHQAVIVGDKFMRQLEEGDAEARRRWGKVLQKRKATGEPYIMYKGNVNKANPEAYKQNSLKVFMTNICSEIVLHTDESHSFVCCLSSVNLAKYDEWKDTDLIYTATWFLDGVLEEFIQRAKNMRGFENSVRSAEKGRALGLGVLGWHTYLQQNGMSFEGLPSQFETRKIFSQIKIESERASRDLAQEYGEPLWCIGTGMRNTHLRAIAPTVSNSKLSGNVSGKLLPKDKIDPLTIENNQVDWPKDVFKTFKEINQLELVKQAGVRQQYIDQSVSLNLAFPSQASPKWINQVHLEAWKQGIKTLYYMRTESVLRGDIATRATDPDCVSCDG